MNIRFTKIKLKEQKVFLIWEKYEETTKSWDEYSLRCADPALPSLYDAMKNLDKHIAAICELPAACEASIEATGVSFTYVEEGRGCVITGKKILKSNPAPMNLNTPYKVDTPAEGMEDYALSDECIDALQALEAEAFEYINGHRAQGNLFEEKPAEITEKPVEIDQTQIFGMESDKDGSYQHYQQ